MAIFNKTESVSTEEKKVPAAASAHGHIVPEALFGPRLSEKSSRLAQAGKYVFNVGRSANKVEIKKAVEKAYKVNVIRVNILNTKGKTRVYGRTSGKTSPFKKAIVTLKEGQKIEGATETI